MRCASRLASSAHCGVLAEPVRQSPDLPGRSGSRRRRGRPTHWCYRPPFAPHSLSTTVSPSPTSFRLDCLLRLDLGCLLSPSDLAWRDDSWDRPPPPRAIHFVFCRSRVPTWYDAYRSSDVRLFPARPGAAWSCRWQCRERPSNLSRCPEPTAPHIGRIHNLQLFFGSG